MLHMDWWIYVSIGVAILAFYALMMAYLIRKAPVMEDPGERWPRTRL